MKEGRTNSSLTPLIIITMEALSMIITAASFVFTAAAIAIGGYLFAPYWAVRKVPGPVPLPLIGHLHLLAEHGPDVFSILANRYGPIFRFHMGRQPLVIVASPELCREVGIKKFKEIPNRSIPTPIAASLLHQKGLFITKDERWSTMRNTIVSLYQPSHLASLIPTMQATIDSMVENINPSEDEDIAFCDMSLKLATDLIGKVAFGVDFGLTSQASNQGLDNSASSDSTVSEFLKQHIFSTEHLKMDFSGPLSINVGLLLPVLQEPSRQVLRRIPGTMDWKVDRNYQKLGQRLDDIVAKRTELQDHGSNDFLSLILNERASDNVSGKIFSLDYVSALSYEHLLAGSTTISFTLSSVVYLVSGHLEVERKMLDEIDAFGPRTVSASDLQNEFPYLDQVIKEAMRFYLLSPLLTRVTSREVEIGGYTLPKGTWVWPAPGVLAKDPKNFPEPENFPDPKNFPDPSCEEEKQRHPYAFIPFGIGPRSCIGQKFSLQETKLALINLYRKYVFRHAPSMEKPLELEYGIILNFKHGVKVRAIKRSN